MSNSPLLLGGRIAFYTPTVPNFYILNPSPERKFKLGATGRAVRLALSRGEWGEREEGEEGEEIINDQ